MVNFLVRRFLLSISTMVFISMIVFVIIQLPEGDYIDTWLSNLQEREGHAYDNSMGEEEIQAMREFYGLDDPIIVAYAKWVWNMARWDFGFHFDTVQPVTKVIGERLPLTVLLAVFTVIFTWTLALPIGIYSAVRQHSAGDYAVTFIGFIGLAVPDFLLALVLMYFTFVYLDWNIGGLFSPEFIDAEWSTARAWDFFKHLWIPAFVLGTSGTAALVRIMRANLLDELHRPYVVTARAKGLGEWKLILKYPVRVALNPFISTIGYILPFLISGSVIVSVVLSLPTVAPILLRGLLQQDTYLAGTIILLMGLMTVIGTLISDVLLVFSDPRIRIADSDAVG